MTQQRFGGCFVKWFYLVLIVQTFLCIGHLECRQPNNRNNNNNSNNNNNNNGNGDGIDKLGDNDNNGIGTESGTGSHGHRRNPRRRQPCNSKNNNNRIEEAGISLWINEQQLKMLSALYFPQSYSHRIYAIHNGRVTNEMRDTTVYNYLVIPSEVNYVNFTWNSGRCKYFYHFDPLHTMDESILKAPTLSINKSGVIPQEQKNFSIFLPCTGNSSGTASFNVGLKIQNRRNQSLSGTPIRLNFKKECAHRGVYDIDASNPTSLTTLQGSVYEKSIKCFISNFKKNMYMYARSRLRIYQLMDN